MIARHERIIFLEEIICKRAFTEERILASLDRRIYQISQTGYRKVGWRMDQGIKSDAVNRGRRALHAQKRKLPGIQIASSQTILRTEIQNMQP